MFILNAVCKVYRVAVNPKMWCNRLRGRRSFGQACNELTKGWKGGHRISKQLQDELLEGFRKFYDKRHWKYALIQNATGIVYVNTVANSTSFAVVNPDGTTTTVSRFCKPVNIKRDIREACRGAVHREILMQKKIKRNHMDHCNPGGFAAIFKDWVKDKDMNELYSQVIHNDPRRRETTRTGFKTFKEPVLTEWTTFHRAHAKLQELTPEEHLQVTRDRM